MKIDICTKCGIDFWLGDSQDGKCPSCFEQEVRKSEEMEQITEYKYECGDCGCYYWVLDRDEFECPKIGRAHV